VERYQSDGKQWGMPVSMSVDALTYNLDLFDAAGLKYPPLNPDDKSWTMEVFLEYAQRLTRGREQFGFSGSFSGGWPHVEAGHWFGQAPFDDKRKKAMMDAPNFRKAVQFWLDLGHKYRVQPNAEEARAVGGFNAGKIGMQVMWGTYKTGAVPFRWALATLPYSGPGRNMSGRMAPVGLHMGRTPRAAQAWEVFKWLTRPENGARFPLTGGHSASPLVRGGSDLAQRLRREESGGVDHKAYVLQAQYSPLSAGGMHRYPNFPKVDEQLLAKWKDLQEQRIGVDEYCRAATEISDQQLVPRR
jgi:multiple sugar transport system substrate-binding protein